MVELLVVMVIIALLGGVVVPNISQWIESRALAQQKKSLAIEIASLPAKAHFSQTAISITEASQLNTKLDGDIEIKQTIEVLSNGYCLGGALALDLAGSRYHFTVTPPLCLLSLDE
ncbi:hypothetical protein [Alteromonas gracilis]|uniref:hypothetical protein n=1 Tax=Alteromonas gracilis TaxID=1479524 RepID=UPI003219D9F5